MIKPIISVLCATLLAMHANAATQINDSIAEADTLFAADTADFGWPETSDTLDIEISEQVDSLSQMWFDGQVSAGNDTSFVALQPEADSIPDFPDSVYRQRLEALPLEIELSYNKIVSNLINLYSHKRRDLVENMLGVADYYFPIFEDIFDSKGMPTELKYLAVIESALNPVAVSRVGATGLWQFMHSTGRMYKLEVNSLVDERRDPIKSTYAAANFMSDMYQTYHDWILVIAAYNCGPGNVNKAIKRSGGKRNYWDIYYHLPRETRGYVPAYIAAAYIMNYYKEHNLKPVAPKMPVKCDTVMVHQKIHFEQINHYLDISVSVLRNLNPQYRHDIIPGHIKPYALRLPTDQVLRFIELEDSISHYNDAYYFRPEVMNKKPEHNTYIPGPPKGDYAKMTYTVKSGDNLGYISSWYGVRVSDIKYWNGMSRNTIRGGQKLIIYVPKSKAAKYEKINTMTFDEKQASVGKAATAKPATTATTAEPLNDGEYEIYTVRRGDSLWEIARTFNVTEEDIKRWNGLSSSRIDIGQKLKIKR